MGLSVLNFFSIFCSGFTKELSVSFLLLSYGVFSGKHNNVEKYIAWTTTYSSDTIAPPPPSLNVYTTLLSCYPLFRVELFNWEGRHSSGSSHTYEPHHELIIIPR